MKISNQLLDTGFLYPLLKDTLTLYEEGKDLTYSPVAAWGRKAIAKGEWWYGGDSTHRYRVEETEQAVARRLREIVSLYEAIKREGYNGSPLTLTFSGNGAPVVYDGYHRLCILKYLNYQVDMECRVRDSDDFPLLTTLKLLNEGENLYQPTGDDRTVNWRLWRSDCPQRLGLVAKELVAGSVLDCGCESGYFTRGLTRRGFQVTGLDYQEKRASVARYLAVTQNLNCSFIVDSWQNHIANSDGYSNVLLLSVLHHEALQHGVKQAFGSLELLRGKAKRVIVEFPLQSEGVTWSKSSSNRWSYTHPELTAALEEATQLKTRKILEAPTQNRPIIVLGA